MAKTKKKTKPRSSVPKIPTKTEDSSTPPTTPQPIRETIESFAIAIVLAFLIRTFAAEAFVIPTGSMANTLMGQHQDVYCAQCEQRYQVSASDEQDDSILKQQRRLPGPVRPEERKASATVAGTCPTCRNTMIYSPRDVPEFVFSDDFDVVDQGRPYGGDRIIVNKFIYDFQDPKRWDVIVFRYPGDASTNYIKRLVGLPNEKVRVYQGDIFVSKNDGKEVETFEIQRKPVDKILAIRELVHDTEHDAAELFEAGWPLRWIPQADIWKADTDIQDDRVVQKYVLERPVQEAAWLQYLHTPPTVDDWILTREERQRGVPSFQRGTGDFPLPELIGDFNAYNSNVLRGTLIHEGIESLRSKTAENGVHWVGDLILEATIDVTSEKGHLLFDLVKGGRHFVCEIDIETGKAGLRIEEFETRKVFDGYSPQAETTIDGSGTYRIRYAHVDEQLLLWIDNNLVEFDTSTAYNYTALFGDRQDNIPRSTESDRGDLAPAAIGARDATMAVDQLNLSRDIYYIAIDNNVHRSNVLLDFPYREEYLRLRRTPQLWDLYRDRRYEDFVLGENQLFVMGDNSAASQDARLWANEGPGGQYLDADLLIGKAVFVYWPHSWYSIPKTPIPLWPNFRDMRLVR